MMDELLSNTSSYIMDTDFDITDMILRLMCMTNNDYLIHMILLALFSITGVIGNVCLLCVVWSDTKLRNSPNILLTNLAFADLMYILVTAPIRIEHELHPCWLMGPGWCMFRNFVPVVCQSVCVLSLVALSRERYSAIVHGFQSRFNTNRFGVIIACVATLWVLSILCGMPIFWFSYVNNAYACINVSKSSLSAKIYETCRMVFLFVLPLMLIAFHYFKMASTLLKSTKSFQDSNSTFIKQTRARARLAYLAITISVFFGVFWFPSVVYEMWFHFANNEQHFMEAREFINTFRHFHYYMSLANSCLNPWIVFIMSSSHRRKLLQPFSCCTEERRSVQSDAGGGVTCNSTHVAGAGVSNTTCV